MRKPGYHIEYDKTKCNFDRILQAISYVLGCWKLCMIFFSSIHTFFTLHWNEKKSFVDGPPWWQISLILKLFIQQKKLKTKHIESYLKI